MMIETPKGLERAGEILSTPGIDGAIMGTGDYSQAVGLAGQPDHPEVWKACGDLAAQAPQGGGDTGPERPEADQQHLATDELA